MSPATIPLLGLTPKTTGHRTAKVAAKARINSNRLNGV
jgi:hypothetical protein